MWRRVNLNNYYSKNDTDHINTLPDELVLFIFKSNFTQLELFLLLSLVSKRWNKMISTNKNMFFSLPFSPERNYQKDYKYKFYSDFKRIDGLAMLSNNKLLKIFSYFYFPYYFEILKRDFVRESSELCLATLQEKNYQKVSNHIAEVGGWIIGLEEVNEKYIVAHGMGISVFDNRWNHKFELDIRCSAICKIKDNLIICSEARSPNIGRLSIWKINDNGAQLLDELHESNENIYDIKKLDDNHFIYIQNQQIKVQNIKTFLSPETIINCLAPATNVEKLAVLSKDIIAVGLKNGSIEIYDLNKKEIIKCIPVPFNEEQNIAPALLTTKSKNLVAHYTKNRIYIYRFPFLNQRYEDFFNHNICVKIFN